jgi:hypothetical protein
MNEEVKGDGDIAWGMAVRDCPAWPSVGELTENPTFQALPFKAGDSSPGAATSSCYLLGGEPWEQKVP